MDDEQEILLGELREEVNYLHEQLHQKSSRAARIIEFNIVSITIIIGLAELGGTISIGTNFLVGGLTLGFSTFVALYCVIVGSNGLRNSHLVPSNLRHESDSSDGFQIGEESGWMRERIKILSERIAECEERNRILSKALISAGVSGPFGVIILLSASLDNVEQINRGPLGTENVILISFIALTILVSFSLRTIRRSRSGEKERGTSTSNLFQQ